MIRKILALATLCFLSLQSVLCFAQTLEQSQRIDDLLAEFYRSNNVPGIAVSIGKQGRIVWSMGYGYADLEQQVPVYPSITRFRVGSVAKPLTATAIGILVQEGRLDLDAPVQTYVPEFPRKDGGTITTRLLAGHLGGIRHYDSPEENFVLTHFDSVTDALDIFKDDPLVGDPGSAYSYSSYGFNLISAVVQRASGEDYLEFMEDNVFDPIGMNHTEADQVQPIISGRSRYYDIVDGELVNSRPTDNSYKWAGGGFLSTTEDLVRFGLEMLDPTILEPDTLQLLWTPQRTSDGTETRYGIGWNLGTQPDGDRMAMHTGGSVGGSSYLGINRDDGIVVAIAINLTDAPNRGQIVQGLWEILEEPN